MMIRFICFELECSWRSDMNKKIIAIVVLFFIIIFIDYILPLSTITNYRDGSFITFHFNREEINNASINAVLYNVEKQYGFLYIASWCPDVLYPCENE